MTLSGGRIERVTDDGVAWGSIEDGPLAPRTFDIPAGFKIEERTYYLEAGEPLAMGYDVDGNMFIVVFRQTYGLMMFCEDEGEDGYALRAIVRIERDALTTKQ